MTYQRRIPPIRLLIGKDKFNEMIEILSSKNDLLDEEFQNKSIKLKEKLLKYSIPREDENKKINVDIRFYPNEAEDLLFLMLNQFKDINISQDYYEQLIQSREK